MVRLHNEAELFTLAVEHLKMQVATENDNLMGLLAIGLPSQLEKQQMFFSAKKKRRLVAMLHETRSYLIKLNLEIEEFDLISEVMKSKGY